MANLSPDRSSSFGSLSFARSAGPARLFGLFGPALLPDQFSQPLLDLFQRLIR
jgi:hypothetical protein